MIDSEILDLEISVDDSEDHLYGNEKNDPRDPFGKDFLSPVEIERIMNLEYRMGLINERD